MRGDRANAGTWNDRFGFEVSSVGIESIEFTEQSRQLVQQFASNKMNVAAYEGVSQQAGNMAAQQRIAQGIQDNGFGDGGMLLGMNMAQAINPMTAAPVQAPAPAPATGSRCSRLSHGIHVCGRTSRGDEEIEGIG